MDKLLWMVQYELFILQLLEFYVCYKLYFFFQVKIGWMKICFILENQMLFLVYEMVNFSCVIECLVGFSGDVCGNQGGCDMGLQVGGELFKIFVDDYFLEYWVGVYNGFGFSMKDYNDVKDFVVWFIVQFVKGLKMGVFVYIGKLNDDYMVVNDEMGEEIIYNINMKCNCMVLSICYQIYWLICRGGIFVGKRWQY